MFPPMPAALCRLKISSVQRPAEGINQITGISNLACHSLSASLQVVPSKTREQENVRSHCRSTNYYNTVTQICFEERKP